MSRVKGLANRFIASNYSVGLYRAGNEPRGVFQLLPLHLLPLQGAKQAQCAGIFQNAVVIYDI